MRQHQPLRMPGALDVPDTAQMEAWNVNVEQMIWGHRLINDQTSWLLLLETVAIMASRALDKNVDAIFMGAEAGLHEAFTYHVPTRRHLRDLLFKDHELDAIARNGDDLSDQAKWERWRGNRKPADVDYLRERFGRFTSFHDAVDLLRAAVVEPERDRRPTSRHLVPGGVDMLTADYKLVGGKINSDRKFYARGGELVFLMLNRSRHIARLGELVRRRILTSGSRWNKVARLLQPDVAHEVDPVQYRVGYLPLPEHPIYDKLAEDWIALLSLEQLPDDQLAEPLMRLTGLHIVRYLIERSAEVLGRKREQPIPLDMATESATGLRRVSRERFQLHREMSRLAISKIIDDFAESAEWKATADAGDPVAKRKKMLDDVFSHEVPNKLTDANAMIEDMRAAALTKHVNHLGQMLALQTDRIGLGVARQGQGRWYAASNGFLEAIVLANVTAPVELEQHLQRLWDRYSFVVGPLIGQTALGEDAPFEQLKSNQRIFEERLQMLGFVQRLSDDCAFVQNPYS